ncbi:MAG: phosphopyruvate hydratase [Candidatus Nealsonbacteria bacterium]|nr:phosphopyruvate hydratase [Candidatus Nealsonbacteria bacterium]
MNGFLIKKITGKEILDSRKNPTVEISLFTEKGLFKAAVPSGASTGKNEAIELRDGGKRLNGKGVLRAVANINKIIGPKLKGKEVSSQKEIDDFLIRLDGTKNKSKLGANAICGVSMAVCRAGAKSNNIPLWKYISLIAKEKPSLPTPCFNIINGGAHAGNDLDFQEFMVVPLVKPFSKSLDLGLKTYLQLKEVINEKQGKLGLKTGDEGGFAPKIKRPEEALDLISEAVEKINLKKEIKIILDVASSQFFKKGEYKTVFGKFNSRGLIDYYFNLIKKYPIIGLEDPLSEEDWKGWKDLKSKVKKEKSKILIIGDDLLTTNPKRIKEAKKKDACNAMILKINQIGTVSEAIESGKLAKSFGWKIVVSHRSGETKDNFIADLAVGIGADFIKTGAPFPIERMAKYNRLAEIEKEIGN